MAMTLQMTVVGNSDAMDKDKDGAISEQNKSVILSNAKDLCILLAAFSRLP
jgi:hypothetical protein